MSGLNRSHTDKDGRKMVEDGLTAIGYEDLFAGLLVCSKVERMVC